MMSFPVLFPSAKRRIWAVVFLIFILSAACLLYWCLFSPLQNGICIGEVKVGGLSPWKAREVLESAWEETLLKEPLPVSLPEEPLMLSPDSCDFQIRTVSALWEARCAESDSQIPLLPYLKANEDYIRNQLTAYAARYDTELTEPVWQLEGEAPQLSTDVFSPDSPGQTLVVTLGVPELHLDCEAILTEILRTASHAVSLCREGQYALTPEVTPAASPQPVDAAAIAAACSTQPVNDSVDLETYAFLPGSYGTLVEEPLLAEMLRKAQPGETIRIPLQYLPPEILGDDAYFRDVLGAYETRHTNDKNRNTNLQIQCDALDGLILQPGEVFSMNGVLGERTEEKGYLPAPAYSGNRLVNSPGGGVCQGTTTLYNCVLLADLEVVFRACHGVKVGYVPLGLDAAVNFLTTDFQFRNNFHFPIQLRAWLEDEHVKMQILGIDEKDYYIKMETGSGEDEYAWYARSYKCKYDKETDELISRDIETYSTYYKDIG